MSDNNNTQQQSDNAQFDASAASAQLVKLQTQLEATLLAYTQRKLASVKHTQTQLNARYTYVRMHTHVKKALEFCSKL